MLRSQHNQNFSPATPKKIVVGMSGGVDSSLVAALLKQQGHDVIGLFMRNWEETDANGACSSDRDYADVVSVCQSLGIPHFSINFSKEYKERVFTEFLEQLKLGLTPNPDILCNREIKFKVLLDYVNEIGADYLATGHYAQRFETSTGPLLAKGADQGKDQTYFLYTMNTEILQQVLFPIGHLQKSQVRSLAQEFGLATSQKKDSTGICFIGERKFRDFIQPYLGIGKGCFQTLDGTVVGEHLGVPYYTIGQRKGLGLGGPGSPWFVVGKDREHNIVFVERGETHPALYADGLIASSASWIDGAGPSVGQRLTAKIRYRQQDQSCWISRLLDEGSFEVIFDRPQRAITPAQSIVFYKGEQCLGGAFIRQSLPSYFSLGRSLESSTIKSGEDSVAVSSP